MSDVVEDQITSAEQLRELLGPAMPRAVVKERTSLHDVDRQWLAASPLCLVATADAAGNCDVSPKGDPAGFVHVIDDTTIAIPDRPGNRRADGFHNILENPHVGLIFFIPGRGDTIRINGRARLRTNAPYFDAMTVKGHRPKLALEVAIDTIFFHCAKAFMRSGIWDPQSWRPDALETHARLVKAVSPDDERPIEEIEAYYGPTYAQKLYKDS